MLSKRQLRNFHLFFTLFLFKYKITTLSVMQDSSHLTIILCSSVIKIVISQKQKFNRKNNNKNNYYYSCFPRK
jgi:pyruvate formate-lyase activating enzyme-like uncharacterized protein